MRQLLKYGELHTEPLAIRAGAGLYLHSSKQEDACGSIGVLCFSLVRR